MRTLAIRTRSKRRAYECVRAGVVGQTFYSLPEIVQICLALEVELLKCVEQLECERGSGAISGCRKPSPAEKLCPFSCEIAACVEAFAEPHFDRLYALDIGDHDATGIFRWRLTHMVLVAQLNDRTKIT